MKVVTAYRPFVPESNAHQQLGPFDWVGACEMLRASVRIACGCETVILSDAATPLPGAVHRYHTSESRLMLWLLEVWLRYLESDDFDQDTAMISPDTLVFANLRPFFQADLGLVIRVALKYQKRPLLNGVQFWAYRAKPQLVRFFRQVYATAQALPDGFLQWGADTEAMIRCLPPRLEAGFMHLQDLHLVGFRRMDVLGEVGHIDQARLARGQRPLVHPHPMMDFKYLRKRFMRQYFEQTIPHQTSASNREAYV